MLAIGSVSVATAATKLPVSAPGPGSLVLVNTGTTDITIGGSGVAAGSVGAGSATIKAGSTISLPLAGGVTPGTLYGIVAATPSVLNWFYSTEIT